MNHNSSPTPNIWALLIGIDCYMGRTINNIPHYPNLGGCVNDIALMDEFLRTRFNVPAGNITKLTASGSGPKPEECEELWPTRANIVAAFRDFAKDAKPGDQLYMHYSGHGGRTITVFPQVKGENGLDEALVPTDYGQIVNKKQPEDRYLRDVDLATLLQELVDRELSVTVVLDSCHSGGAARKAAESGTVRGGVDPDMVRRTPSDLVATLDTLMNNWQAQTQGMRAATVASGWLPEPSGYTVLAACRALELASEYNQFHLAPNGKRQGYFTYWLWHTLQSPITNWNAVHQQVVGRVHGLDSKQTPQIQGLGNRPIFGGASINLPVGINVLEVQGDRLRLNTGQSAGVGVGAQYFVYKRGVTDFKQLDARVAVIELTEVMDADAWAQIVRRLDESVIEPGAQALLFDPGRGRQRTVRLVSAGGAPVAVAQAALDRVAEAITQSENRFVRLAVDGEHANLQVGVTAANEFEICDDDGHPLPNVPTLPIDAAGALAEIVYRLTHLAKYFNVLELSSPDTMSRLAGKLEVTLMRTPDEPFAASGGIPTVKHTPAGATPDADQLFYLRIHNLFEPPAGEPIDADWYIEERHRRTMNITVLDLAPDWSISRFLPAPGDAEVYYDLEPGETLLLPRVARPDQTRVLPAIASSLPKDLTEADEILKVFATTDTTGYDSLQLSALDETKKRAQLVNPQVQGPERNWITTQVMVRVVKET